MEDKEFSVKFRAKVIPRNGEPFHLWWNGPLVMADAQSKIARDCADYLNDRPFMSKSAANEGGTDSHWSEKAPLQSEDDFLLTVGSLVDHFDKVAKVDLIDPPT